MTREEGEASPPVPDRLRSWATGRRLALVGAIAALLVATVVAAVLVLHTKYAVLFTRLNEADASVAVEKLKASRTPYRLADGGTTILVPADRVYDTRLALVSQGMPVSGGVGFEIFDKQGFGMSEASQRVAYQRALQGELARTIGAIDHVVGARVHLVLPESTLFKRDREPARAAVSLTLDEAAEPSRAEIRGIQRLVAASVPGLDPGQVVITDQHGIALTPDGIGAGAGGEERLQVKQAVEQYVTRKVLALLDDALGPGQAIVSVDATVNFDEVRRTVQDLLPAHDGNGNAGGWVTRRRTSSSTSPSMTAGLGDPEAEASPAGSVNQESDYQYGSRVEQVVSAPGGLSRLTIAVVVRPPLSAEEQGRLRDLVRMSSGLSEARGDTVVLQSLAAVHGGSVALTPTGGPPTVAAPVGGAPARSPTASSVAVASQLPWWVALAALLIVATGFLFWRRFAPPPAMSNEERARLLAEIRAALAAAQGPLA